MARVSSERFCVPMAVPQYPPETIKVSSFVTHTRPVVSPAHLLFCPSQQVWLPELIQLKLQFLEQLVSIFANGQIYVFCTNKDQVQPALPALKTPPHSHKLRPPLPPPSAPSSS